MDTELLKSMFLRARDHYERAVYWAFLGFFICLALHALTFSQFVRLGKELTRVQTRLSSLTEFQRTVTRLESELSYLEKTVAKALETQTGYFLDQLIGQFEALNTSIAELRGEQVTTSSFNTGSMAAQYQVVEKQRIFLFDEELQQKILAANSLIELETILLPVIETDIIQPQFDQLNQAWREHTLPTLTGQIKRILAILQDTRPAAPEAEPVWHETQANLEQVLAVVADITFQPPVLDSAWWESVSGKREAVADMESLVLDQLKDTMDSGTVTALSNQIASTLRQQQALQTSLQEDLDRIEECFVKQQSHFALLGKPFEFLSFDIDMLVSRFPLLLGIMLAAITVWPARRLWEVAWTAELMAKQGQEPIPLAWLKGHLWMSLPQTDTTDTEANFTQRILLENVGRALLFCLWVGIAAWEFQDWEAGESVQVIWFMVAGWVAIAAAQGYRFYILRRIFLLKKAV